MSKKLDIAGITNELEGSAFFPSSKKPALSPTPPPALPNINSAPTISPKQPNHELQGVPPPVRGTVPRTVSLIPKVKRPIKQRQPFDIYEDQYETLKRIAASEKNFENGRSMSQMVREAIDTYLKDHNTPKK